MSRIFLSSLVLLSACGGRAGEPIHNAPEPAAAPAPVTAESPAPVVDGPRASCRSTAPATHPALTHPGPTLELGARSFALSWQGSGAETRLVIASLDERGGLVTTPVPFPVADPVVLGGDAHALLLVSVPTRGTGTLMKVAIGKDGALTPGAPRSLPEVGWGWPAAIVSDGEQAILQHTLANTDQSVGTTALYTIDLASERVVASSTAPRRVEVHCHAGSCATLDLVAPTSPGQPARASLVRGAARLELELTSTCPAFYPLVSGDALLLVAPADPWRAVEVTPATMRELAIAAGLAGIPDCPSLMHPFPSARRPGLLAGDARELLRWDPARASFGASEALPPRTHRQSLFVPHPDGVIEVSWTAGHGMMHSPTDSQGRRRYYTHWSFEGGQVALLRHEQGAWAALDATPLALGPAEGTFHDGYTPVVLRHGLHAAVLLAPDGGGDETWLQPYLAPCP